MLLAVVVVIVVQVVVAHGQSYGIAVGFYKLVEILTTNKASIRKMSHDWVCEF